MAEEGIFELSQNWYILLVPNNSNNYIIFLEMCNIKINFLILIGKSNNFNIIKFNQKNIILKPLFLY